MRTAAEVRQEIADRLGFVPAYLQVTEQPAALVASLWQSDLAGHRESPLPTALIEELFIQLARSWSMPACVIAHCCNLWALGVRGEAIDALLAEPLPTKAGATGELVSSLERLEPIAEWPDRGTASYAWLRQSAIVLYTAADGAQRLRQALARVLGERWFGPLTCFLVHARAYQGCVEMYPEAPWLDEARAREALQAMVLDEPRLAASFEALTAAQSTVEGQPRPPAAMHATESAAASAGEAFLERERLFSLFSDCVCIFGADGRFRRISPAFARALGYSEDVLLAAHFLDLVHPDDVEPTRASMPGVLKGDVHANRYRCADGSYRWFEWRATADGTEQVLAIARDLTETRAATLAVETAQAQFRNAFEFSAIGMALVHLDGRWMRVNQALTNIIGYTEAELLGKTFQDITHPDHLAADLALIDKLVNGDVQSYDLEKRYFHRKGHIVWILLSVSLVRSGTGEPLHFISQIQDISHRKAAEQQLRASEGRYRALSHQAPVGIFETDANGDCRFVNRRWQDMTGASSDHAAGQTWVAWVYQPDRERVLAAFYAAASENREFALEFRFQSLQGVAWVWGRALALRNDEGVVTGFLGTVMDITSRKNAESALEETLREKETMLKEIHHRVKNNLQVISSLLYFQSKALPESAARALFRESQDRVRSMALIHEKLYQSTNLSEIDFADYVRGLTSELLRSYGSPLIEIELITELESVLMDLDLAIPCGLILNELFSNALKHAFVPGAGGTVTVELRRVDAQRAMLAVSDSGRGLPVDLDIANAASLGLKLVKTFAGQIDGRLVYERGPGGRFTVEFALPTPRAVERTERVAS